MENNAKMRFEIEAVSPYKEGVLLVGRCTAGPIKVGDVFHQAIKRTVIQGEGRNFTINRKPLSTVKLEVVEIQYFRTMVPELLVQYSGAIYVRGENVNIISEGCEVEA